jgi:ribosomal protein S12 methylthiotransferase accessory factor
MVFVPYVYDEPQGERPIQQPISTGLACHCSFEEAAISGLCEVIERDAFLITWQATVSPPCIRTDTLTAVNRDLVERFLRTGNQITLLNITTDAGVPTILAVSRNDVLEAPAFVCAASTHLDPEEAIRKSLEEVAHTRVLAQGLKKHLPAPSSSNDYRAIMDQDSHIRFYGEQANLRLTEFLFASEARMDWREIPSLVTGFPEQDLTVLSRRIAAIGYRPLISDITTPDVASLGLVVVRAIIPGFHPLFLGHRLRALGGSRLWELPQKLGYPGISYASGDNNAPHPYP